MAYADHSMGSSRMVSIIIVALIHAVLGYAFVTGLGMKYVKKAAQQLNVIDVQEEPPPPEEEPPPRSEEHTSELQSLMRSSYAVFCLKKQKSTPRQCRGIIKRLQELHR